MASPLWRIPMALLSACLTLFAVAQYNDPDPQIWVTVYSVGAIWTSLAAFAPHLLRGRAATLLLLISVILALCAVIYFWPATPNWWRRDVWWWDEEAREGMGMMILAGCIALVAGYRLVARRGA